MDVAWLPVRGEPVRYVDRSDINVKEVVFVPGNRWIGVIHRFSNPFPRTPNPPRGSAPRNAALRSSSAKGFATRCSPRKKSTLNRQVFGLKNGDHPRAEKDEGELTRW
jgi:hypothetical protein